jgi:hypothetical protein
MQTKCWILEMQSEKGTQFNYFIILPFYYFRALVTKVGCTTPWGLVGLPRGALSGKRVAGGLEVGPSVHIVHLLTIEVTSDETVGNWYHFIKPIHCIKNLLTVK